MNLRHVIGRPYHQFMYRADTYILPDLSESQYWPIDRQLAYQNERFVEITRHHYTHNPAYRRLCSEHGIDIKDVRDIRDIIRLPIIDRSWLKNNSEAILGRYDRGPRLYTGGSTGEPLEYGGCVRYHLMRERVHQRGWRYFGFQYPDEFIVISSAQGKTATSRYLDGDLTLDNLREMVDAINKPEGRFIRGYASSIYILATYMNQRGLRNETVCAFNLISENVYDWQVRAIRAAFPSADVFEEYCCNDGGASAWECLQHSGLHEAVERSIIETDENGEMIVTDLWNRAMPFIRYRNGDYLQKRVTEPCACGRLLPRIWVRGRTNDIIVTPSGPVSPTYLMYWGAGYDGAGAKGFSQLQYVQNPGYRLTVYMVKNDLYSESDFEHLSREVGRICKGMSIEFMAVDQITTTTSGKRKFIINNDHGLLAQWGTGTR